MSNPGPERPLDGVTRASVTVAVDAMGGDDAPATIVQGAQIALAEYGVRSLLVGDPAAIGDAGDLEIQAASEVVAMGAEPAASVRRLKDSSIVRAAEAVRDGRAGALLSAGNTGAAMAASLLRLGRIKGVARPAIAVPFPVIGSTPTTLLDCGANADCQPEWLVQFARLGVAYTRTRFGVERPRVAILTIGEEAGKGNTLVKEACTLLEQPDWADACGAEYIGNMEGYDLMNGAADVMVTDGFTGNVVLKSLEAGMDIARDAVLSAIGSMPEAATLTPALNPVLDPVFDTLDSRKTGAAMLLGTKQVSIISHGSSDAVTIANAIRTAAELVEQGVVQSIRDVFATN